MSKLGIQQLLDKLLTITNLTAPQNIDKLSHFLKLTGYYRKFVPLFADITTPSTNYFGRTLNFSGQLNLRQLLIT